LRDSTADSPQTSANGLTPSPAGEPTLPGYEILAVLAQGGSGVVYKARQRPTDRPVALKMLTAGVQANTRELARLRTEGEAAGRVCHPHIVAVYEVGEHAGLPFVALEFMDRGSLADAIGGNPLPPARAAELVEVLARAVQAAHEAGI